MQTLKLYRVWIHQAPMMEETGFHWSTNEEFSTYAYDVECDEGTVYEFPDYIDIVDEFGIPHLYYDDMPVLLLGDAERPKLCLPVGPSSESWVALKEAQ